MVVAFYSAIAVEVISGGGGGPPAGVEPRGRGSAGGRRAAPA